VFIKIWLRRVGVSIYSIFIRNLENPNYGISIVPVAIDALILDKHKTEIEDTYALTCSLSCQAY
jgi:hypothetical protein